MPEIVRIIIALVVIGLLYDLAVGLPWIGRTSRVVDGDSVEVIRRGKERRIRLAGVDAPEYRQDYGKEARIALASMVEDRLVLFVPFGREKWGRQLCTLITITGIVSWRMAMGGHAWPESSMTRILHLPARTLRRGLWGGSAELPGLWRRRNPWKPATQKRPRRR